MNQHHVQEAYLKSFGDPSGKLWVYPKRGGKPLRRTAKQCASREDFQSRELELLQNRLVETPGIRAMRANGSLSEQEYHALSAWMALHILRNARSRFELFDSRDDFDARFMDEFGKERLLSDYYRYVFTHPPTNSFFVTSDNPVIEFAVEGQFVRCCAISPEKMMLFSPIDDQPFHELGIEDMFNALVWANAVEYVFSHRKGVSIQRLEQFAKRYKMEPVEQNTSFLVRG